MADFSKLNASVAKLAVDEAAYETAIGKALGGVQAQVDAAQVAVDAVDTSIVKATVALAPPVV